MASEVASFKMTFIRKAGTSQPETLVSEKNWMYTCHTLAEDKKGSFLEWASSLINKKESFAKKCFKIYKHVEQEWMKQ